ncbi:2Fe-2S iron-sulfur cluster protein [Pacificibacter maritimus]|uniref:2Fe-2S iron-sulfur cluster protein n=1 Tax=Pacificibacter maritimus TaxID=762213 RepID=A0A3N4UAH0_9RHOB|nr:(2Fe-2S)-binding protein [Pacificibacter maritimus]RPE67482.1 2Fe-2S iron-sulfur cluster protein [Pacificibacter maritimus]
MFKPLETPPSDEQLSFTFDGKPVAATRGMSVAGALFQSSTDAIRNTPVSGSARGPFCMMGACYDCLVQIDGVTVQACQIPVTDGLVVSRVPNTHKGAE